MVISSSSSAFLNSSDPGQVFTARGNDFLSPGSVQGSVHSFSTSNTVSPDMFGKNPNSRDILNITKGSAQDIFTNSFGVTNLGNPSTTTVSSTGTVAVPVAMPVLTTATPVASAGTVAVPVAVPVFPVPTTVVSAGSVTGQVVMQPSPALVSDMANFNPLMWVNPSASNVTLGIMDSFNKVMGGDGIFTPTVFNNGLLYPFIAPQQPVFSSLNVSTMGGGDNKANSLNEALLFPNTAQSGSNLWNTTLVPTRSSVTTIASNGISTTTTTSTTPSIGPFGIVAGMFALLWASVTRNV